MLTVISLGSCGSNNANPQATVAAPPTTVAKGPSLTTAQASTLAKVLYKNHQAGGADVDATIVFGSAATFRLKGVVDWTNGVGKVLMTTERSDKVAVPSQTLAWGGSSVFLSVAGLTEALAADGRPGISYVQRPVAIETSALDQVITLIASFSSAKVENPLLLRQDDTSFEGKGKVGGRDVERLRYKRSTYSIANDGFAYRLDTTFKSVGGPVTVLFANHGDQVVPEIDPATVVPMSEVGAIYERLLARKT